MQTRKISFVVILVLLILFLPLTIFATIMHFKTGQNTVLENYEDVVEDGKISFYNQDTLLGTYTCQNTDYCDYAFIRYNNPYDLQEPESTGKEKYSILYNRYTFLMDAAMTELLSADILLYDIQNEQVLSRYKEVKNYGGIENDLYFVKNEEDLWGAVEIKEEITLKIPFQYDYIGLANQKNETDQVKAESIVALKDGKWFIINQENNRISDEFQNSITNYNENYVIVSDGSRMRLLNYRNINQLSKDYRYLDLVSKYVAILEDTNDFYLFDPVTNQEISKHYTITDPNSLSYTIQDGMLTIYENEELLESIAIV